MSKVYIVCLVGEVHRPNIQVTLAAFSTRDKANRFVNRYMKHNKMLLIEHYTRPSIEVQTLD